MACEEALLQRLREIADRINSFYPRQAGLPKSAEEERLLAEAREIETRLRYDRSADS